MSELHIVNYAPYHKTVVKPRGFNEFCDMIVGDSMTPGIKGIWEWTQTDTRLNKIVKRIWSMNVITDAGANAVLQRACNSASATLPALFNQVAITNNSGSTTLTTALAANATAVTSLAVAAVPAAIPNGTILTLGYGGAAPQNVTVNGAVSSGATSITVNSFTVNSTGFAIGAAVVPNPSVTDNPTSLAGSLVSYSGAMPVGGFTYTPTSGAGNRTLLVQQLFQNGTGTNTPVGNYTDGWIVNTNPVAAAGQTLDHIINAPMRCDSSNTITTQNTLKI